jgi:hypothetical protein
MLVLPSLAFTLDIFQSFFLIGEGVDIEKSDITAVC